MNERVSHKSTIFYTRPRKTSIDLEWLKKSVNELSALREVALECSDKFTNGVVYAIRLEPKQIPFIDINGRMGIEVFCAIPTSQIVGKIEIPSNFERKNFLEDRDRTQFHERKISRSCKLYRETTDALEKNFEVLMSESKEKIVSIIEKM